MTETAQSQWAPYEGLMPFESLAKLIDVPKSYLREAIRVILPSVTLAKDGPVLKSVHLVTDSYLCEVRCIPAPVEFDVARLASIVNYRIRIETREITQEDAGAPTEGGTERHATKREYDMATVTLAHAYPFATELTYVGEGRDAWLNNVLTAIPIAALH